MKKKLNLCIIIVTLLLWLTVFLIKWQNDMGNIDITLKDSTLMGTIINIFCIISMIIIEKKVTSPYIIFQILSLPFLYGQLISRELLGITISEIADLTVSVTNTGLINSCFLIMYCQLGLHFGNLVYKMLKKDKYIKNKVEYNEVVEIALRKVGLILLIISIVPAFYDLIVNLKNTSVLGYQGLSYNTTYGIASVFDKIIPFFQISLFMLMVAYKEEKIKSKAILIFLLAFYGIQMFFGNRGIPIIAVITSIWLYHVSVKKFKKSTIFIILIMAVVLSVIMNVIRVTRTQLGFGEWINNLGDLMRESVEANNNPIVEVCYEMGTAIYPTAYTMDYIPSNIPFKYGKTYLLSLMSVVLINTTNVGNSLAYDINIAAQITKVSGIPFGGSYIQEAYANFGWMSPVFMICLGILLEILNRKIKAKNQLITIVLIAYFLNPLLWIIRNVSTTLPREFIWYILPTYLLYKLIYNGQIKRGKEEINVERKA